MTNITFHFVDDNLGVKGVNLVKKVSPLWFFFDFYGGKPGTRYLFEHLVKCDVIFNVQCFSHRFESVTRVIFQQYRNILAEGKAFVFLLEYVPVASTGFAIHASVIFSLKLSLQATRLV